jgi:MFS family permease
MMSVSPLSARISTGRGPKTTLMLGAVIVATGYGLSTVLMSAIWQLVLVSCIVGAGAGFAYGAMPALAMAAVPPAPPCSPWPQRRSCPEGARWPGRVRTRSVPTINDFPHQRSPTGGGCTRER